MNLLFYRFLTTPLETSGLSLIWRSKPPSPERLCESCLISNPGSVWSRILHYYLWKTFLFYSIKKTETSVSNASKYFLRWWGCMSMNSRTKSSIFLTGVPPVVNRRLFTESKYRLLSGYLCNQSPYSCKPITKPSPKFLQHVLSFFI